MPPISTSQAFVTGPQIPFSVNTGSDTITGSAPLVATGAYFNGKFRLFCIMNLTISSFTPSSLTLYETNLSVYSPQVTITPTGEYSMTLGGANYNTGLNGTSGNNDPFNIITTALLIDTQHLFVLLPGNSQLSWYSITASTTEGDIIVTPSGILSLPVAVNSLTAVTYGENINILYPMAETSEIGCAVFNGTSITSNETIDIGEGPVAPFHGLESTEIHISSGQAAQITFIDANQSVWSATLTDTALSDLTEITPPTTITNPVVQVAEGPLVGQTSESSSVFLVSDANTQTPSAYWQTPIGAPAPPTTLTPFTSNPATPIANTFSAITYAVLPNQSPASAGSLFRLIVFGVTSNENNLQLYLLASGQLISDTTLPPTPTANPSPEFQKAYQASWSLLGIVQGAPPSPNNTGTAAPPNKTSISITFNMEDEQTSSVSFERSFTVGYKADGVIFSTNDSVTHAITQSSSSSQSFTTSLMETSYNGPITNQGLLLFHQPTIKNTPFELFSPDGTDLNISFHILEVTDVVLGAYGYDITNPDKQTYSAGMAVLPQSGDIQAWQNVLIPVMPSPPYKPEALSANVDSGSTSSLSETDTHTYSTINENSISICGGAFGFSTTVEGTWTTSNSSTTAFTKSYSAQTGVIIINTPPKLTDIIHTEIQPLIFLINSTVTGANQILPTLYKQANPWLITWQVISIQPYGDDDYENDSPNPE